MKNISALILALALSAATSFARAEKTDTTKVVKEELVEVVDECEALPDSVWVGDSLVAKDQASSETPKMIEHNGEWYVRCDSPEYIDRNEAALRRMGLDDFEEVNKLSTILLIVFGIPCLTIIVGILVVLIYSLKRTRSRNELINNAIDHNYPLPDAFYNSSSKTIPDNTVSAPMRDSRRFYRAIALISVGISVIVFAAVCELPFFYMVGGIPFLIGVGQMIGYFTVPTYNYNGYRSTGYQYPPMNGYCQRPMPQQPAQPMPQQPSQPMPQQPAQPMPQQPSQPMPQQPSQPMPQQPAQPMPQQHSQPTPPPFQPGNGTVNPYNRNN